MKDFGRYGLYIKKTMKLSYIINSDPTRQDLTRTLGVLAQLAPPDACETWVVDNGYAPEAQSALRQQHPAVQWLKPQTPALKSPIAEAIERAAGKYLLLLNDDTHPAHTAALKAAVRHLEENPQTGAVVGRLDLESGKIEMPEFATLMVTGATCVRASAIIRAGGYPSGLSTRAADYDLSLRIWNSSYRIDRRQDIEFNGRHALPATNLEQLLVINRYLPTKLRKIYGSDWMMRFKALTAHSGNRRAAIRESLAIRVRSVREAWAGREQIGDEAIEGLFNLRRHAELVGEWARRSSVWRVVLAGFSENLYAGFSACQRSGLQIRCVADNHPAFAELNYRGVLIVPVQQAFDGGGIDGVVVTSLGHTETERQIRAIRRTFRGPILRLWEPSMFATNVQVQPETQTHAQAA
jgi:hypothetical protein